MAQEQLKNFLMLVAEDADLQSRLKCNDIDPVDVGREFGFEFTIEDIQQLSDELNGELSDDELANASGGVIAEMAIGAGLVVWGTALLGMSVVAAQGFSKTSVGQAFEKNSANQ